MPDVTTICRRCTECEGQEHHWLSDPRSATNVDDDDDDLPIDKNGDVDEQYVLACKHCPATKPYDPDEEDEDSDYDDEDWDISLMVGRTIVAITGGQDAEGQLTAPSGCVEIILDDGAKVRMSHTQDCCESVELVDIAGDVADLIGSPLTMAEEVSNSDDPHGHPEHGLMGVHADASSPAASEVAWGGRRRRRRGHRARPGFEGREIACAGDGEQPGRIHRLPGVIIGPVTGFVPRPYQEHCINGGDPRRGIGIMPAFARYKRVLAVMATGCHARGQLIMMADGSTKRVEGILIGDLLMGPDLTPRTVLSLARGRQEMRRIIPETGAAWIVNLDHVLTLANGGDDLGLREPSSWIDITVREYLREQRGEWHPLSLIRVTPTGRTLVPFWTEKMPEDDYFGFTLDGDHRYLLADGTVTHNCSRR